MTKIFRNHLLTASALAAGSAAVVGATPAFAQGAQQRDVIVVTAQRQEEDLQDVPISITVFNQEQLENNNIVNAKDLATFTPGVVAQTRFGNDVTTYTIRGFAQEQRTTATVGTYFAEVVAPRGNGVNQGGDGASPGQLFDLENVQVLKGPQGTLFGRNTTGGAVLIVPVKPRDEFEGYLQGGVGNLGRWSAQGVVNVPVSESFRVRLGFDHVERDGYIKNVGLPAKHDDDMGSIDYWSFRASAVLDVTEDIENYTIFSYSDSQSSGAIPVRRGCSSGALNASAAADGPGGIEPVSVNDLRCTQEQNELNQAGPFSASNANPQGESAFDEWRVIIRTSWIVSESLTGTTILGYSELKGANSVMAFGLFQPIANPVTGPGDVISFVPTNVNPDLGLTANQRAFVEEFRLSGDTEQLQWQAGIYYERSSPIGPSGTFSPAFAACDNILAFDCTPGRNGSLSRNEVTFETIAAYAQATYQITPEFSVTGGIRYTEDKTKAQFSNGRVFFAADPANNTYGCGFPGLPDSGATYPIAERFTRCQQSLSTKSSAPTWLLGLDYEPSEDILLYAKYSRGYRQGSLSPATGITQFIPYGEEELDSYEAGAKISWFGPVSGRFNVAGFYNDFRGQQIQLGLTCDTAVTGDTCFTTLIANADKSETYGVEADVLLDPGDGFKLEAAYSYNKAKLLAGNPPNVGTGFIVRNLPVGSDIPLTIPHQFNATASWTVPVAGDNGDITFSGSVVHLSAYRAVADEIAGSNVGVLPSRTFGNASVSWKNVMGAPLDATFYATNITNEVMYTHVNDQSSRGIVSYSMDEPRQYGLRLKYRFGGLAD